MGLHKWIYKGRVKKHLVEVNHSPESGKLMIKLNGEMMLYDYGITADTNQNRNYFIIIDGALCSVNVFKKNKKKYQYDFLEEEVMAGKRIEFKKDKKQKQLYWLFGIIIILIISVALLPFYKKLFSAPVNTLSLDGAVTTGAISSIDETEGIALYEYFINGQKYHGKLNLLNKIKGSFSTPDGLPVKEGDQFEVRYDRDNFSENILLLSKPDEVLLNQYLSSVADKFKLSLRDLEVDNQKLTNYCNCLSETIFENFGLIGLSLFYHNLNLPKDETGFKQNDFQLILKSPVYFSKEVECREDHLFPEF